MDVWAQYPLSTAAQEAIQGGGANLIMAAAIIMLGAIIARMVRLFARGWTA